VTIDADADDEAISAALRMGYRHLDTADMYENHAEVANAMAEYDRADIFLTSKVRPEDQARDDLIAACERSLQELRTDYLDMYLLHWPNPALPMAGTFGAMAELVERALVRSVGVSNFTVARLRKALDISPVPISNNQIELHPMLRQPELVEFCQGAGVAVTAYCPIARGAVYDNEVIGEIADETGHTCAQVSLRWLLQRGCAIIPRSRDTDHIAENFDLFDWELSADQVSRIDAIEERTRLVRNPNFDAFDD
jgi:diketogulonate reductase-like aldo/keto reductase